MIKIIVCCSPMIYVVKLLLLTVYYGWAINRLVLECILYG